MEAHRWHSRSLLTVPNAAMVAYADTSLAIGTTVFAAFVLVWKIAGADLIPGFEQIFGLVNDDAQYPRRRADAAFWQLVYLCMYGGLGLVGCGAGLYISLHKAQHGLAVVGNGALSGAHVSLQGSTL